MSSADERVQNKPTPDDTAATEVATVREYQARNWDVIKFVNQPSSAVLRWTVAVAFGTVVSVILASPFVMMNSKVRTAGHVISELGVRTIAVERPGTFRQMVTENTVVKEGELIGVVEIKGLEPEATNTIVRAFDELSKERSRLNAAAMEAELKKVQAIVAKSEWKNVDAELSLPVIEVLSQSTNLQRQSLTIEASVRSETAPLRASLAKVDEKIKRLRKGKRNRDLEYFVETIAEERRKLLSQIAQIENGYSMKKADATQVLRATAARSLNQIRTFVSSSEVRAPIEGRLYRWHVPDKAQVQKTALVAEMLPSTSKVIARLDVKPNDQPKIASGQRAFMKLEAFPYQRFGLFQGHVLDVKPVSDANGAYSVTVEIEPNDRVPASTLPIGSAVQADIVLGEASLFKLGVDRLRGDWK